MKTIINIVLILLSSTFVFAQEQVQYEIEDYKLVFTISENKFLIQFDSNKKSEIEKLNLKDFDMLSETEAIFTVSQNLGSYEKNIKELPLALTQNIKRIEPFLVHEGENELVSRGEIIIKTKDGIDPSLFFEGRKIKVEPNPYVDNLYLVHSDLDIKSLMKSIQSLNKDDRIEYAEPNLLNFMKPLAVVDEIDSDFLPEEQADEPLIPNVFASEDPLSRKQWAIRNVGQNIDGVIGLRDADMDIHSAWPMSKGRGITVAILDDGVQHNHPDLRGKVLPGFDAHGQYSDGRPGPYDYHGTACAGIVGARANNDRGIAGVAYKSKILPVRIFTTTSLGFFLFNPYIATIGFYIAVINGADIISCSWGGSVPFVTIKHAITSARRDGRNGKGTLVLASSGNNDTDRFSFYPASFSNVISVGASTMCNQRKYPYSCDRIYNWGSNYGRKLNVVAPGTRIYTTDVTGRSGYSRGNYVSFQGTSAACPNAAAVAALLMAKRPNYNARRIRRILERYTFKPRRYHFATTSGMPHGTWNYQVGYGIVNARKALRAMLRMSENPTAPEFTLRSQAIDENQMEIALEGSELMHIEDQEITNYQWQVLETRGKCNPILNADILNATVNANCNQWSMDVEVTATNKVGSTSVMKTISPAGIEDYCQADYSISKISTNMYQLTTTQTCNNKKLVERDFGNQQKSKLTVYDINGQFVFETFGDTIDLNAQKQGIYILKLNIEGKEKSFKLIRQ